jgi:hypothetical protein
VTKRANATGALSWSWKVGTRTTPGSWPVIISCKGHGTAHTAVRVPEPNSPTKPPGSASRSRWHRSCPHHQRKRPVCPVASAARPTTITRCVPARAGAACPTSGSSRRSAVVNASLVHRIPLRKTSPKRRVLQGAVAFRPPSPAACSLG